MSKEPDRKSMKQSALGTLSQRFAAAVITNFPQLEAHAQMMDGKEVDGFSLYILLPSPTQDNSRSLEVWVDEICTPSIGFGPTHTHESADDGGIDQIIDRMNAIFRDELVIIEDAVGGFHGHVSWVDLRVQDALMEELTNPHTPDSVSIKSWSGKGDRVINRIDLR